MPRLISSLSRILKLLTLSWLSLIGLWTFLPSPAIHQQQQRDEYIQKTLASGDILHTVYSWKPSFAPSRREYQVAGRGLLIDWRLVSDPVHDDSVVLLEMGRDLGVHINLTDAILKVQRKDDNEEEKSLPEVVNVDGNNNDNNNSPSLYISSEMMVPVDAGIADDLLNMPWFHWPDRILFQSRLHGSTIDMQLQVVARRHTGTVEIWKSGTLLQYSRRQKKGVENLLDMDFDRMSLGDRANGVLASFSNIYPDVEEEIDAAAAASGSSSSSIISIIEVADMEKAELFSKTYRLRSLILGPLAPSLTVVFFLLFHVFIPVLFPAVLPVLGAYIIVALICWAYYIYRSSYGRESGSGGVTETTAFAEWCSWFPITRHVYSFLYYCCCCGRCCCLARPRRRRRDYYHHYHRYWPGEKRERVVIWGPAGPVYEG